MIALCESPTAVVLALHRLALQVVLTSFLYQTCHSLRPLWLVKVPRVVLSHALLTKPEYTTTITATGTRMTLSF